MDNATPDLDHLRGWLAVTEARVRHAIAARWADDPTPDDPVRGLYISEADVERLLAGPAPLAVADVAERVAQLEADAQQAVEDGVPFRLTTLAATFGLARLDLEILLITLLPDLDSRFERLFGYLQDDVTRRRASIGLVLELLGRGPLDGQARARLTPEAPLVNAMLIEVGDGGRPLLTRSLRVDDRVSAHLLGDDQLPERLARLLVDIPSVPLTGAAEVARALRAGSRTVYVQQDARSAGLATAACGIREAGGSALVIDAERLPGDESPELLRSAVREAGLRNSGLVIGPIDALVEEDPAGIEVLSKAVTPVVVVGSAGWDPAWLAEVPATVPAASVDPAARVQLWRNVTAADVGFDAAEATAQFRLRPEQALRAWQAAANHATAQGTQVGPDDLRLGARLQNAGRLDHLARRISPSAGFADLVLPTRVMSLLREIVERARHREQVLDEWHMGGRSEKGRGITSLFAGESGTGKTLSAEVIATELGLDLYVIDLSTVVDKYIGETEKNLERIFSRAEDVNGILFFDEADALFGKRSEVSDARDRYANLEIAYLLQRMERFDGITILASNLRANLDEAFTRRIDVLIDFPSPEEEDRRRLWELHLPATLMRDDQLDLDYLAKAFELAGGDIRNVTLAAAYAAAVDGTAVGTHHLIRATAREYRKLGRLVTESEFGPYYDLVTNKSEPEGDPDGPR